MATVVQPDTQIDRLSSVFSEQGRDLSAARNMVVSYFTNIDGLHSFLSTQEVHQDFATSTKELINGIEAGDLWTRPYWFDVVTQTPSFEPRTTVRDAVSRMCLRNGLDEAFVDSIVGRSEGFIAPIVAEHPTATRKLFDENSDDQVYVPLTVLTNELTIYQMPDFVVT